MTENTYNIVWSRTYLGIVQRKNYLLINCSGEVKKLISPEAAANPFLVKGKDGWIALTNDVGVFFDRNGNPKQQNNIVFSSTPGIIRTSGIVSMLVQSNYLIVLRETSVSVYNILDSAFIQDVKLEQGFVGKALAQFEGRVFVSSEVPDKKKEQTSIFFLQEISPEDQINKLIFEARVDEALKIFSQNSKPNSPDYVNKFEKFHIEAAWALFRNLEFEKAVSFFLFTNYDPRELIVLVPELKNVFDIDDNAKENIKTIANLIDEKINRLRSIENGEIEIQQMNQEKIKQDGGASIIQLLQEKREFLKQKHDFSKDLMRNVDFAYNEHSINYGFFKNNFESKNTLDDVLLAIDSSLIILYVKYRRKQELYDFLENEEVIKCNVFKLKNFLLANKKLELASYALALLNERLQNYTDSLKIWQDIGTQKGGEMKEEACRESVKILSGIHDRAIIFDFAKWILIRSPEVGLEIFMNDQVPMHIMEDDILNYLEKHETFANFPLKERYLEYLISTKIAEERFHTQLALHYVAKVQTFKKIQESQGDSKKTSIAFNNMREYRSKLMKLLKTSSNYSIVTVLDSIKGMELFEEEILLYSKQKMHNEALNSLVEMGKKTINFRKAEEYCLDQEESLLALLFKKIISEYSSLRDQYYKKKETYDYSIIKEMEDLEKQIADYQAYSENFLIKYATNEKMDAEQILLLIPDDWTLKGNNANLFTYLTITMNDRLSKELNYKMAKNVSQMEDLNLQSSAYKLQKAYVQITPERICKACHKKLKASKAFAVYPNGVVVHNSCAKNLSLCPVTNINFEKKNFAY